MPPLVELESLLADDCWIRRLAGRLVADPAAAEDLVQETWVAALTTQGAVPSRPWLGRVLRNTWKDFVRARARRNQRERAAARDEATEPADECVVELELRERVARALRELEEPYRSAVYLRFFRGESLAAIGRREGIAVSTAHERVERGLARLRVRLDDEHGGRREAWAGALITLAGKAGKGAGALEVLTMAGVLKIATSVLVLGAGAAWWWSGEHPHAGTPLAADAAPASTAARTVLALPANEPVPREQRVPAPETEPAPISVPVEPDAVSGRVLDVHGLGVEGVELGWREPIAADEPAFSRRDGSFELELAGRQRDSGERVACRSPDLVTLVSTQNGREWAVVVAPRASFAGTVVDESGAPVAGAGLAFRVRESLFREIGLHALGLDEGGWSTSSDALGRFELADVAGGASVFLAARATGFEDAEVALCEGGTRALLITLQPRAKAVELTGVVLDPGGSPVPGANVSAGKNIVLTGADGRFALLWDGGNGNVVKDGSSTWREQGVEQATLIALKEGYLPAEEALRERDLSVSFVLRLGPAPLAIRGVLVDAERGPAPGLVLWVPELTRFGRELVRLPDGTEMPRDHTVESFLGGGGEPAAISAPDGAFELTGLTRRGYSILAFDPRTASRCGPWTIEGGADGVELVFTFEPTQRVAGRVVSARGKPRAGLDLRPKRALQVDRGADAPQLHGAQYGTKTDAEGRFEFERLATRGTALFLEGPYIFHLVELADFTDLEHLEIVEPELCEAQIELSGDPASADLAKALDGSGAELETMEVTGNERMFAVSMGTEASLVDGRSRLLLIKETARTLVLYKAGSEILRLPIRLEPGQRTVLRP